MTDKKTEGCEGQEKWRGLLLAAADEIEKRGWCKGTLENQCGEVCAHGALNTAYYGHGRPTRHSGETGFDGDIAPATVAIARYIHKNKLKGREYVGDGCGYSRVGLAGWNDCGSVTKKEVVAVFRGAAKFGEDR